MRSKKMQIEKRVGRGRYVHSIVKRADALEVRS